MKVCVIRKNDVLEADVLSLLRRFSSDTVDVCSWERVNITFSDETSESQLMLGRYDAASFHRIFYLSTPSPIVERTGGSIDNPIRAIERHAALASTLGSLGDTVMNRGISIERPHTLTNVFGRRRFLHSIGWPIAATKFSLQQAPGSIPLRSEEGLLSLAISQQLSSIHPYGSIVFGNGSDLNELIGKTQIAMRAKHLDLLTISLDPFSDPPTAIDFQEYCPPSFPSEDALRLLGDAL